MVNKLSNMTVMTKIIIIFVAITITATLVEIAIWVNQIQQYAEAYAAIDNLATHLILSLLPTALSLIIAAVSILILAHTALKPLKRLTISAKEVAKGNTSVVFKVLKNDEVGQVSASFMEIITALNILKNNFKHAKRAILLGNMEYSLEDSRLGGIYDEMLDSTNEIVSHIQRLMYEAQRASEAKSDFLSKMSHEIRTPLNAILGMTELILLEDTPAEVREHALTINQSGKLLLSIINDILDLSKIESGNMEIIKAKYYSHSAISDVVNIINVRMTNPKVQFVAYMEHDLPNELYGDEVRMRQVLLNILTNAVKYTKEGTITLEVSWEKTSKNYLMLTIRVSDTGIGIKKEDLDKLFENFTQFDTEANQGVEGTGLGLPITLGLVKLMGGNIEVDSTYGQGSVFTITLPQKFEPYTKSHYIEEAEIDSDGKSVRLTGRAHIDLKSGLGRNDIVRFLAPDAKVLVIDDVPTNLKVAQGLLKQYGMDITLCGSGKDAITAVQHDNYDIVFMDHMMPEMNGLQATQAIRNLDGKYAKMPIIALSANALVGARAMFLKNGLDDFISKPIELSKLNDILLKWIPKDKQKQFDTGIGIEADSDNEKPLTIDGVDVKIGLAHSGNNMGAYMSVLEVFHKDSKTKLVQLAESLEENNISLYTTYVHAVKASCANIGAMEISEKAGLLEIAGSKHNFKYITKHNGSLVTNLKTLLDNIEETLNTRKPRTDPDKLDKEVMKAHLVSLKAALESFDMVAIDDATEALQDFTQLPDIGKDLGQVLEYAFMGRYKNATIQIDELLEV